MKHRRGRALRRRYGHAKPLVSHYRGYTIRYHAGAHPDEHVAVIYGEGGDVVGSRMASSDHGASIRAAIYIDDMLEPR